MGIYVYLLANVSHGIFQPNQQSLEVSKSMYPVDYYVFSHYINYQKGPEQCVLQLSTITL